MGREREGMFKVPITDEMRDGYCVDWGRAHSAIAAEFARRKLEFDWEWVYTEASSKCKFIGVTYTAYEILAEGLRKGYGDRDHEHYYIPAHDFNELVKYLTTEEKPHLSKKAAKERAIKSLIADHKTMEEWLNNEWCYNMYTVYLCNRDGDTLVGDIYGNGLASDLPDDEVNSYLLESINEAIAEAKNDVERMKDFEVDIATLVPLTALPEEEEFDEDDEFFNDGVGYEL